MANQNDMNEAFTLMVYNSVKELEKRVGDLERENKYLLNSLKHVEKFLYYENLPNKEKKEYQPELFTKDEYEKEPEPNLFSEFVDQISSLKNSTVSLDTVAEFANELAKIAQTLSTDKK